MGVTILKGGKTVAKKVVAKVATKTATKTKAKPVLTPKVEAKSMATAQAEEFILLHKQLLDLGAFALLKTYDETRKKLVSVIEESGADAKKPYEFVTARGTITFSACQQQTIVNDKAKMIEKLGDDAFAQLAKVNVGDLSTYLSAMEIAEFTTKCDGPRRLQAVVVTEEKKK